MTQVNRLPPIQSLAAFESAARLGGFAAAADELHVTPGAVSYRIRQLEQTLGASLFVRSAAGARLNPTGLRYLSSVRAAFDRLGQLPSAARPSVHVRVSSPPTFARNMLVPRLPDFQRHAEHVAIEVVVSSPARPLLLQHDVDIRFGCPPFDERLSRRLFDDVVVVLASRRYVERIGLHRPADLARATLLRSPLVSWQGWLERAGLPWREPRRGMVFTDLGLLLEAAASGLGAAACPRRIVQRWIERGALHELFGIEAPCPASYHLLVGAGAQQRPEVTAFADWMLEAFR